MRQILFNNQFTYIEEIVLEQLLLRNSKHQNNIKTQITKAKVESRNNSNVGFITKFLVPDNIPALNTFSRNKVLDVYAEHPDVPAGASFLLWFEKGKLSSLEGYVFMGHWPMNELKFRIVTTYDSLCGELAISNRMLTSVNYLD